jgi:RNA polymerase sigma-70 factor (ECF subfamily)
LDHQDFLSYFLPEELHLRSYLLAATGDVHDSDDLLQIVARVLWEKAEQYDESRPFRQWALGIARMEVLKWKQRTARSKVALSDEAISQVAEVAAESPHRGSLLADSLRYCLENLKHTARRVVDLKYSDGLAIREIAARLEKSLPAVEMILVRSRRSLRECVQRQLRALERD